MFAYFFSFSPLFTIIYLCFCTYASPSLLSTYVYTCLLVVTYVYPCLHKFTYVCSGTYASNYLLVINCLFMLDNLFLPMFSRLYLWLLLFTYVYLCLHCLLVFTYVYPYFLIFTYVHSYLLVFITSLVFTFSVLGNLC